MNNCIRLSVTVLVFGFSLLNCSGQPGFQNLGFENASLVPIQNDPFNRVEFSPALPGWVGYIGGTMQTSALVNNTFLSGTSMGLVGIGWSGGGRIQGNWTALLQPATGMNLDASLAQTGLVPIFSQSLLFYALPRTDAFGIPVGLPDGSFVASLGGQPLQLFNLGPGPNNSIAYGADIHAWAGQSVELRFTALALPGQQNNLFLDSIQFSPVPVPEPSSIALVAMGACAFGVFLLRKTKQARQHE